MRGIKSRRNGTNYCEMNIYDSFGREFWIQSYDFT